MIFSNLAYPYNNRIADLQRQLEKQTNTSCQNDIDLAREQDKNAELKAELKQLRSQNEAYSKEARILEESNEALHTQQEVKDASIAALREEIHTLRRDYAIREEELVALANAREASLAGARISYDRLEAERQSLKLSLAQAENQVKVSKENECSAKERLMQVERECADKMNVMAEREKDAVSAATSDLEARLQLFEEKANIAEKNETFAHARRREAEVEVTKVRSEAEENLCKAKEQIKHDYEQLLQSKNDERSAIVKCRQADRLQMDDMRNKLVDQEADHAKEVEGHMKKLDELSCALQQTSSDLTKEKEGSTSLRIDLANAQTQLETMERRHVEDEHQWKQDNAFLENEISKHKGEAAHYMAQLNNAKSLERELQNQLQKAQDRHRSELARLEARATSAIKAMFDEVGVGGRDVA